MGSMHTSRHAAVALITCALLGGAHVAHADVLPPAAKPVATAPAPTPYTNLASPDFSVRVRAAETLGAATHDAHARAALEATLRDVNPAVRGAAVAALAHHANSASIPALEALRHDSSAAVRAQVERTLRMIHDATAVPLRLDEESVWNGVRYVIELGRINDRSGRSVPDAVGALARSVTKALTHLPEILFVPTITEEVREQSQRHHVPTYRLDVNLTAVTETVTSDDTSIRCEVGMVILDGSSNTMRGSVSGAGTTSDRNHLSAPGAHDHFLGQSVDTAVHAAVAQLPESLPSLARQNDIRPSPRRR